MQGNVRYFADSGLFCHSLPVATSATLTAWVNLFLPRENGIARQYSLQAFCIFLDECPAQPQMPTYLSFPTFGARFVAVGIGR